MISINLIFSVSDLKHEFGHVPKLLTARSGESIGLSCFPPEGNPRPTISWTREGQPLKVNGGNGKYSLDPSGVLLIKDLDEADSARYECSVENEVGSRSDSPVTLTVTPAAEESTDAAGEVNKGYIAANDMDDLPAAPVVTSAVLLDRVTGLVRWRPVTGATGYVVRVAVAGVEITNISVEDSVSQVKLHSLDPAAVYAISLAAVRDTAVSEFSAAVTLGRANAAAAPVKEVTVHMTETTAVTSTNVVTTEDIPTDVWVVGMVVVVLVTLLIIISAVLIFHRLTSLRRRHNKDIASSGLRPVSSGLDLEAAGSKTAAASSRRYSWIDRRWGGETNPVSSFRSDATATNRPLLATDSNHYDYVLHRAWDSGKLLMADAYQIPVHKLEAEIYHYASAPIIKKEMAAKEEETPVLKEYLMPIQPKKI